MATPLRESTGTVERSSWKANAIRRGQLRISGPLPFAETPERPASKRHTTDNFPSPKESSPERRTLLHKASLDAGYAIRRTPELPEIQEHVHPLRHKRSSTGLAESSRMDQAKPFGTSGPPLTMRPSKRQKRSSIKATLKKIFGKKIKEETRAISPRRHDYHNSEPAVRTLNPADTFNEQRADAPDFSHSNQHSFAVGEIPPRDPLRSHLPFPMNVNAPPQDDVHDYITFNRPPLAHRRRATLPSVVFSTNETEALSAIWSETGTRVTSMDERELAPEHEIGVAVTSAPHPLPRSNRRSRSAGALEDLKKEQQEREASLRASIDASVWRKSGATHEEQIVPQESVTEEILREEGNDRAGSTSGSPNHSSETVKASRHQPSMHEDEIRAFNFGSLAGGASSPAAFEAAGAPVEPPLITLEERMERVESNMRYFDQSLRRLNGRNNRQTIILENAPKGRRSRARNHSSSTHSSCSQHSLRRPSAPFTEDATLQASPPVSAPSSPAFPPPSFSPLNATGRPETAQPQASPYPYTYSIFPRLPSSRKASMPNLVASPSMTNMSTAPTMVATTTATAGPYVSTPTTATGTGTADRLATLYTLLYQERAARKELQAQVHSLQAEMDDLRLFVGNRVSASTTRAGNAYPTPSPDQVLSTPGYQAFDDQEATARKSHFSLESGEEGEDEASDDAAQAGEGARDDEESSPDMWGTPYETPRRESPTYDFGPGVPAVPGVGEPKAGLQCMINAI